MFIDDNYITINIFNNKYIKYKRIFLLLRLISQYIYLSLCHPAS